MSSSSDPSPWSLSGDESLAAYVTLQHAALAIVEDTTLPDDVLLERATCHLQVFERPEFAAHSREKWMKNVSSLSRNPGRAEDFTARRFFDAMIQTADELNLRTGRRFPAAEVCACALLLEPRESGSRRPSDLLKAPRRLAEELSILIFDIWWTALWWPLADLGTWTLSPIERFSNEEVQEFHPDKVHKESDTANNYRTLHLYRSFGQLEFDTSVPTVDCPQNCLLLEHKTYIAFRLGKWTLVPTEEPNKYRIRTFVPPDKCFGPGRKAGEYVTFTGPSAGPGTTPSFRAPPPSPDLLRAHAIFAHFLDSSGLGPIIFPMPLKPCGVTVEMINEQARSLLLPHLPGTMPVPKSASSTELPKTYLQRRLSRRQTRG
ncbi:hypothetical protein K466DRAFT_570439 [Polyporus arcularius HHB13444]|uniref:HNH nuclease domain-containing protein n=1 Tax=Polyporus arcularius HHB13444 TaxID=1314778 RepID=A0A5C3NN81_9APHY|nr:hypothetical protein K466DRAFT_570439 [Polyporus arcularius HHB13444]